MPARAAKEYRVSQKVKAMRVKPTQAPFLWGTAKAWEILLEEVFTLTSSRLPPGNFRIEMRPPFQDIGGNIASKAGSR